MSEPSNKYAAAVAAAEAATTFEELREALRRMYSVAGEPSYHALAKKTKNQPDSVSVSGMSEVFRDENPKKPSYSFVFKFTRACGVPPDVAAAFETAWSEVNVKTRAASQQLAPAKPVPGQRIVEVVTPGVQPEHMATLDHIAEIADSLEGEDGYDGARQLYEHIHDVCQRLLGPGHERTQDAARDLGTILAELEHYTRAYGLLEQTVTAYTDRHGPNDARTLAAKESLAIVQIRRRKYPAAIRLAQQSLAGRRAGSSQEDLQHAVDILVYAYECAGDHQQADRLRQEFGSAAAPTHSPSDTAQELLRQRHHPPPADSRPASPVTD